MGTVTVITPPRRLAIPRWNEIWGAREVLYRFAHRDVLLRYRQTVLGVLWVVLQPLASAGIFSIVFGSVAKLQSDGLPYFLFSFMGMLAWNLFSGVVTRSAPSILGSQGLISKVFFPRVIVPLSTAAAVLIDFGVAIVLGVILLFAYGVSPGWGVLLLPVWVVLLMMFGAGLGLVLAALTVRFRDVSYIVPWLFQVLLYASPVAYPISSVPHNLRGFFEANPITWALGAFRFSLLDQPAPPAWQLIAFPVLAVVVFVGGLIFFESWEREFADVI